MKISQKVKSIYFLSIDIILNQEISTLSQTSVTYQF